MIALVGGLIIIWGLIMWAYCIASTCKYCGGDLVDGEFDTRVCIDCGNSQ